ncbi:MAG TPA: NAD-dependent epimerase/dehydratase family protein [Bryobacteraceae bacterium]|nr:NAD-dependent epimerase/dehydratase family protein [Bryobacteraceae bacterium]
MRELVLVTGGAGFIGSHLSAALLTQGYKVRVLDNLSLGRREWVPEEAEFVKGDIRDLATCRAAVHGCAGIFHMAAMSRSAASLTAIESCTENNILGTQNILAAAREHGVRKVVYSGSSTYYGSQPVPHKEGMRPDFLNMYGLTKYVGEEYCLLFDRLYKTPAVVLRYFNVYGPRQPETGAYALVLGVFLRRWAEGQPLEIHGDGSQRRDFIHVRDVARANIAAYESEAHGEVFNVGSGTSISVKELADMISPDQVFGPRRVADAAMTLADVSRTRSLLGWEPQVPFEVGLRELQVLMPALLAAV